MNIVDGTTLIGVFKKSAAPAPVASPTLAPAPVAAPAPAPVTTPAVTTPFPLEEWGCDVCTYINIPARTVCEMCDTPNPARRIPTSSPSEGSSARDVSLISQSMGLGGPHVDLSALGDLDPETAAAIRQALSENDVDDEMSDQIEPFDLEETLSLIQENPSVKQQFATAYNLPATATIEDFRAALSADPPVMSNGPLNEDALLSMLAHNPQLQDQLSAALTSGNPGESHALYEALKSLVERSGGEMYDEDEDEEDISDMVDDNLEFDQDPW